MSEFSVVLTMRQRHVLAFAKYAHGNQKRKYTNQPYWHHPLEVATIVNRVETALDDCLVEIALLHDVLEDTRILPEEIVDFLFYGCEYSDQEVTQIYDGAFALTDKFTKESFPNLNREKRKKQEIERLSSIKGDYKTVKCADLIDNTSSIVKHDKDFARIYLKEKEAVLQVMEGANPEILAKAWQALEEAKKECDG